jgi:hypothetical protein
MSAWLTIRNWVELKLKVRNRDMPDNSFWFRNYFIAWKNFYLEGARKQGHNLAVVQISDLHLRCIGPGLVKAVKKISRLNPALILFTGDMANSNKYLPLLEEFMSMLPAHIAKAAILGNWEYFEKVDLAALRMLYQKYNCTLLVNESRTYTFGNKTIAITGMDDYSCGHANYPLAVQNYTTAHYHIVLTHCPAHYDVLLGEQQPNVPVNFVLSGHTHGGQINIFGFIPFMPVCSGQYVRGWYKQQHPPMYVSQGIGTSIFPVRIGSYAEIAAFYLPA